MIMLSGLGQTDDEPTPSSDPSTWYNSYTPPEEAAEEEKDPWYKDVGKGLVDASLDWLKREAKGDGGKTPARAPRPPAPPAEAWYSTPTGMVGIGVGVIALVVLLRK